MNTHLRQPYIYIMLSHTLKITHSEFTAESLSSVQVAAFHSVLHLRQRGAAARDGRSSQAFIARYRLTPACQVVNDLLCNDPFLRVTECAPTSPAMRLLSQPPPSSSPSSSAPTFLPTASFYQNTPQSETSPSPSHLPPPCSVGSLRRGLCELISEQTQSRKTLNLDGELQRHASGQNGGESDRIDCERQVDGDERERGCNGGEKGLANGEASGGLIQPVVDVEEEGVKGEASALVVVSKFLH